jgi:hypothetical protein
MSSSVSKISSSLLRELVGACVVPIHRSVFSAEQANLARIAAFDASAADDPT